MSVLVSLASLLVPLLLKLIQAWVAGEQETQTTKTQEKIADAVVNLPTGKAGLIASLQEGKF